LEAGELASSSDVSEGEAGLEVDIPDFENW